MRRRRGQGLLAAVVLFVTAAAVDAGVKLVVAPDGTKSVVHDGTRSRPARPSRARLAPSPSSLEPVVERFARHNDLDERLVLAVIQVESDFDPAALSHKGAMGLMQLMPETARELEVGDPWDPEQNVRGGTAYLGRLLESFEGRLEPALAAYNAGPEAVRRYGGVPPYPETRSYVEKVMRLYRGDPGYSLRDSRRRASRKTYVYRDAQGRLRMSTSAPAGGQ